MDIAPLNGSQRREVVAETQRCIRRCEQLFARAFTAPQISFNLSGRAAGMFRVRRQQQEIRYNPYIFAKYFSDNLQQTVPHEVAHFLVAELHGLRGIRPHGTEWQAVMHRLGAEPSVTCHYDLRGIPQRRQRRFAYSCSCTTHNITTVRHNRVQGGAGQYHCRLCRQPLVYAGCLTV